MSVLNVLSWSERVGVQALPSTQRRSLIHFLRTMTTISQPISSHAHRTLLKKQPPNRQTLWLLVWRERAMLYLPQYYWIRCDRGRILNTTEWWMTSLQGSQRTRLEDEEKAMLNMLGRVGPFEPSLALNSNKQSTHHYVFLVLPFILMSVALYIDFLNSSGLDVCGRSKTNHLSCVQTEPEDRRRGCYLTPRQLTNPGYGEGENHSGKPTLHSQTPALLIKTRALP